MAEANRWVERLEARITEGDAGLGAALALNYAETPHQKSVFRKVKNLLEDLQDKTLQGGHPHGSRGDIQGQT